MTCAECDCICIGDVVEHKMNTSVFGIVIGIAGSLIYIRTSPTLTVLFFHEWELRAIDDDDTPPGQQETPGGENVVDFTKERALRRDTKTEGAA